jgi:ABC-2 type transport system permease protein
VTVTTAFLAELVKLTRSTIGRLVTVLLVGAVPAMAAGFVAAAESGGSSQIAIKVRPLVQGVGWDALTSTTGQVMSISMLLGVGFVVSWSFGREFSEGAIETLLMSRPSRAALASAKLAAVLSWAVLTAVASAAVALGLGTLLGLTPGQPWLGLSRAVVGAVLMALLGLPFAVVATLGRSALAGVGAVIGVIVVTQLLTVIGAGPWFPYAAPSLWLGMGGPEVTVSPGQLLLVLPLVAAGWATTALYWQWAELTCP